MSTKKVQPLTKNSIVIGYIRTSTALQADKVSPEIQEKEIKEYCESKGYQIIGFYRDIEKFRVGRKMVEPSATRSDRPQWLKMLKDGENGKFDGIIAWRTDRLFRGVKKPLLQLSDLINEYGIVVEVVKDSFNIEYAPIMAWATGLELSAKHDRLVMGMTGRFQKNKIWIANAPYGYDYIKENEERELRGDPSGELVINKEEKYWVNQIWKWYADGISYLEIRRRLIENGVQQKGNNEQRKYIWHVNVIQKILKYEPYYTGKFIIKYDGQKYEIDIDKIIPMDLAQRVEKRRKQYKSYPSGKTKNPNLLGGLVYCASCDVRMRINGRKSQSKKYGERSYFYYQCKNHINHVENENCAESISVEMLDNQVWDRLWNLFSQPEEFKNAVNRVMAELNNAKTEAIQDKERIESRLLKLQEEQDWVIAQGRRKQWSDEKLDHQLLPLELEERELRNELQNVTLILNNQSDNISDLANTFAEQIKTGHEFLSKEPKNEKEEKLQFEAKKKLINAFVTKICVKNDKSFDIHTQFDLGSASKFLLSNNHMQKNGR